MSMFFRNWLEEGFYEEDSIGDLIKITDPKQIRDAQRNGKLFENDGFCTSKVPEDFPIEIKDGDFPRKFSN